MARRRKLRRNPSSAGEVIGGVLGFLFPPLGLGAIVTGVKRASFWRGAAIGGVVGAGMGLVIFATNRATLAAAPSPGAAVRVGDFFDARGTQFAAVGINGDNIAAVREDGAAAIVPRAEVTRLRPDLKAVA